VPWKLEMGLPGVLLRFGIPLALAGLSSMFLNAGDRFILKAFTDASEVAIYGLAAKFGGLINMLFVQSFNMAFSVIGLKQLDEEAGTELHRRTFRHYVALTGWGVLGVSLLALDVTAWISPNPAYLDADPLILPISLGFMGYGIFFIAVNVLYAAARTRFIAGAVLTAAVVNALLNVLMIPVLGAMGAALTTVFAYAVLAFVTARESNRLAPVDYAWGALATVLLLVLGLWAMAQPTGAWEWYTRLPVRLVILAAYPLLLLATGVYTRAEIGIVLGRFGRRREP
jgi:O-antigen/teichoic acid export membrane protein